MNIIHAPFLLRAGMLAFAESPYQPAQKRSPPAKALAAPRKALAAPRKALAAPRKALAAPSKALAAPRKALAPPRKALAPPSKRSPPSPSLQTLNLPIQLRQQFSYLPILNHQICMPVEWGIILVHDHQSCSTFFRKHRKLICRGNG